jgi:serine phosphatase RsbU (regulator of sigma subunit)/anti-sigma regulatory factor (Ser/Thr protein kinase)/anti-anti-sigma regulatory factor
LIAAWFDDIPAALWMVEGPEHLLVWMNQAARVSTGDRQAKLGDPARKAASDFMDQAMLARMDSVFTSGDPIVEQDRSVTDRDAHGNPIELVVSVSIVPTRGSNGQVRGLVVQRLDVTQAARVRRRAAEEMAELGARLETSRAVVSTMQKMLLPVLLPMLPGLRLSARYRFSAGQATGGDWFDAVPLAHDRVALVVGDVIGHGAAASAVMGQLRAVLMSYLLDGIGIGEAVARLDRFADRLPGARGATVGVGVLDLDSGQWSYTSCAHPPPIVISPDGESRVLPMHAGPTLGSGGSEEAAVATVTLRPGDTVVIYSDGLVERSGAPLSAGIERLSGSLSAAEREAASGPAAPAPDRICQAAVDSAGTDPADDVTVLAAQLTGAGPPPSLEVTVPAVPAMLSQVRARMREWLSLLDAAGRDQAAIAVATTEAVTNAIDHAYRGGASGMVRVEALLDKEGRAEVTVSDDGRWRGPPVDPGYRGRGLTIMRSLMDSVEIDHDEDGTAVMMDRQLGFPVVIDGESSPEIEGSADPDYLVVEISRADHPVLTVRGPIDIHTVATFGHALADAGRGGALAFTVDMSAVTVLSSDGVQALAQLIEHDPLGHIPSVVAPSGSVVREVLALTGLDGRLEVLEYPAARRPGRGSVLDTHNSRG